MRTDLVTNVVNAPFVA